MKLELTEQDKELLPVLGMLAVAALFLFLVLLPLHQANMEMGRQLGSAKAGMEEKQKKIAALTTLRTSNKALREELARVQEPLYPFMESREIGKKLTEMALEYKLSVRRMEIWTPVESIGHQAFDAGRETGISEADEAVSRAEVLLEVAGNDEGKNGLLDQLAYETNSIRIITMRRMTARNHSTSEEREAGTDVLELRLEILMRGKEE